MMMMMMMTTTRMSDGCGDRDITINRVRARARVRARECEEGARANARRSTRANARRADDVEDARDGRLRANETTKGGNKDETTNGVRATTAVSMEELKGKDEKMTRAFRARAASASASSRAPTMMKVDYGARLGAAVGGLALAFMALKVKEVLDTPSRTYVRGANTVGAEYDAWTEEEILEYYWGEHIHLGYYSEEDLKRGAGTLLGHKVKDFIEAKEDFVDEMYAWSGVEANANGRKPKTILDVGCGIGGASRRLASRCAGSESHVTGITLSQKQADRATALAKKQGVSNAEFKVMDALNMSFPDDTFDLVWACESGEHMPDKKKYVEEMVRVLKPGGTLVIATWCQRHSPPALTAEEKKKLQFLYDEWAHPYFISINDYCALAEGTGAMTKVDQDDWTKQTIVSWRHSIWAGVYDPMPVFSRPKIYYKTLRDIICLERMQRAFAVGLMQYGMIKGVKKTAK